MNNTQCYFCHQTLRNETVEQHAAQCGYVLESCTNKCGAYIPRHTKTLHLKTCKNSRMKTSTSYENLLGTPIYETFPRATNGNYYHTSTLPNKQFAPNHYQSQISVAPDMRDVKYDDLKSKFHHGHQLHTDLIRQIEISLNKLRVQVQLIQAQNQTLVDWRTNVQFQMDGIIKEFRKMHANNKDDVNACRLQETLKNLTQLRDVLNNQQVTIKNEQVEARQFQNEIQQRLNEVKEFFGQELKYASSVTQDQRKEIEALAKENADCYKMNKELREEVNNLRKDLHDMQVVCDKLIGKDQLQEEKLNDLNRSLVQINLDVEVTERSFQNIQGLIATQQGRLMWKINDFNLKLADAKANDKVSIKSPIFYTADYGYKVRVVAYLNGLKKWRGRHLLASLHVSKGDYDDLLKWPCKVEANILLKDLEIKEKPKDYVRYITAKRNYPEDMADDPQESSTEFIFIPHTTLLKHNHLKNDAIYLEIIVNNH